jgi:hypothetical protein
MTQVKRDSSRVAQQMDPQKLKKPDSQRSEISAAKPTQTPVELPTGPIVESQTVVIDNKKPPVVSDKETASFKTGRPVVTVNRTLSAPSRPRAPVQNGPDSASSKGKTTASPQNSPDPPTQVRTPDNRSPVLASIPERAPAVTDRLPPESPKKGEPGTLRVSALPAAEIFIDGKPYGTTNDPEIAGQGIRLDAGSYSIRLKRKGYRIDEQQVLIKSNDQRNLNVTLLKTVDLVELNIRSNRNPAQLVIEDLKDGGRRKEMNMTRSTLNLNLRPGTYRVVVTFEQEVVSRVFELRENEGSQTFTADFK